MRTGCIYEARVQVPEKDYDQSYIGYTLNFSNRKSYHLTTKTDHHFHRVIRKYGRESVTWRIIEDNIEEHRLPDREELWIAYFDTYNNGLNSTPGGEISPMKDPKVAAKVSATLKAQAERGEHSSQRPDFRAEHSKRISIIAIEKAAKGELWMQNPDNAAKHSALLKAQAERGEHSSQRPEVRAKNSATQKAKAQRGELPAQQPEVRAKNSAAQQKRIKEGKHSMQDPKSVEKMRKTLKRTNAIRRQQKQKEAGQLDIFDQDEEHNES